MEADTEAGKARLSHEIADVSAQFVRLTPLLLVLAQTAGHAMQESPFRVLMVGLHLYTRCAEVPLTCTTSIFLSEADLHNCLWHHSRKNARSVRLVQRSQWGQH